MRRHARLDVDIAPLQEDLRTQLQADARLGRVELGAERQADEEGQDDQPVPASRPVDGHAGSVIAQAGGVGAGMRHHQLCAVGWTAGIRFQPIASRKRTNWSTWMRWVRREPIVIVSAASCTRRPSTVTPASMAHRIHSGVNPMKSAHARVVSGAGVEEDTSVINVRSGMGVERAQPGWPREPSSE
jgi:hypothetical protein